MKSRSLPRTFGFPRVPERRSKPESIVKAMIVVMVPEVARILRREILVFGMEMASEIAISQVNAPRYRCSEPQSDKSVSWARNVERQIVAVKSMRAVSSAFCLLLKVGWVSQRSIAVALSAKTLNCSISPVTGLIMRGRSRRRTKNKILRMV